MLVPYREPKGVPSSTLGGAVKRLNSPSQKLQQGPYTVALTPGLHRPALESGRRLHTQAEPEESRMHPGTM